MIPSNAPRRRDPSTWDEELRVSLNYGPLPGFSSEMMRSETPRRAAVRLASSQVREVVPVAVLVTDADGHREILGIDVSTAEDGAGWLTFLRDLTARGLSGVGLVTSDAHRGLTAAIGATLPVAAWQRCRTHYAANLMSATPKSSWPWVKTLLHSVYDQVDAAAVHAQFDKVLDALTDKLPAVADHLEAARDDVLAFTGFPKEVWRQIWSNNLRRAPQPRDPPPHRRRGHLPRPDLDHPTGRRRPGRTPRRTGRRTPLPRHRRPGPLPHHRRPRHPGGEPPTQIPALSA